MQSVLHMNPVGAASPALTAFIDDKTTTTPRNMAASSLVRRIAPAYPITPAVVVCCRRVSSRQTEFMHWKQEEYWEGRRECDQRPWLRRGALPRLLNEGTKTKGELHKLIMPRPDEWHPKEALKGQNDYVDILGDGSIHPVRLLTNVPKWIRGFEGNGPAHRGEMKMLNRKWRAHKDWKETRPEEWLGIKKRIDYLYAFNNLRRRPPPFEDY